LRRWIFAVLLVAVSLSLFLAGCEGNIESKPEEGSPSQVERQSSVDTDAATGSVSLANAITTYLDENLLLPNFGGKVFTAHEILGAKAEEIYVWAYAQEFYKQNNALEKGTGLSCPAVLTIDSQDGKEVKIVDHKLPRDGSFYSQDIKTMFPKKVQDAIFNINQGQTIPELSYQVEERAKKWFDFDGITIEEVIKDHIPKPFNPVIHANKLEFKARWKGKLMPGLVQEMKKMGWTELTDEQQGAMQYFEKQIQDEKIRISVLPVEKGGPEEKDATTFVYFDIIPEDKM